MWKERSVIVGGEGYIKVSEFVRVIQSAYEIENELDKQSSQNVLLIISLSFSFFIFPKWFCISNNKVWRVKSGKIFDLGGKVEGELEL